MIDFSVSAPELAPMLLGCELISNVGGVKTSGIIIETEAYTSTDPASHSYKRQTKRNTSMFGRPGLIYMYRIYGKHSCLNFVCGNYDGQAVLIRSLQPTKGLSIMKKRRCIQDEKNVCNGPAKLVVSLGIDMSLDGMMLYESNLSLNFPPAPQSYVALPRIGIHKAKETLWRFKVVDL